MTYCTVAEVQNIIGSDLPQNTIQALIDQADLEIDAYLARVGLSGSATGAVKAASIKLTQAGAYAFGGNVSSGDAMFGLRLFAEELRKEAYGILANHVAASSSTTNVITRVRAVHGR